MPNTYPLHKVFYPLCILLGADSERGSRTIPRGSQPHHFRWKVWALWARRVSHGSLPIQKKARWFSGLFWTYRNDHWIRGAGIPTLGWFLGVNVGKYTSPMDLMGWRNMTDPNFCDPQTGTWNFFEPQQIEISWILPKIQWFFCGLM